MEEYFVEEKTTFDKIMDVLVFLAVFVVTIFFIVEILANSGKLALGLERLAQIYMPIDVIVLVIFTVDLVRLYKKAEGLKDFLLNSWLDILATIPFSLILGSGGTGTQVLKLAKYSRLSKLSQVSRASKVTRQFKAASHLKKEGEEYQRKHRL